MKLKIAPSEYSICEAFIKALTILDQFGQLSPDAYYLHVPNGQRSGSQRSRQIAGGKDKAIGALAGAGDYLFRRKGYPALWLEAKTKTGTQSPAQKAFQAKVEAAGDIYAVFRSVDAALGLLRVHGFLRVPAKEAAQ